MLLDHDIEWQITEVAKGSKRTVQIHGYRKSQARLQRELSPSMKDASLEIDRAYEDRAKAQGYASLGAKSVNLFSSRGGVSLTDEILDAMRKRITKLTKWEKNCTPFLRNTVYALNQYGHTPTTYGNLTNTKPSVVIMWYKEGLRTYAKMQGWE